MRTIESGMNRFKNTPHEGRARLTAAVVRAQVLESTGDKA